MKLKTLKDIGDFNEFNPTFVNRNILKQEAIKWVKDCPMKEAEGKTHIKCFGCERFMKFHNITEEDLK